MPSVCLYFQVHQPYRLRKFSFFEAGTGSKYFDEGLDELVMKRVADRCYLPANKVIKECIARLGERYKVAFSLTGTAVEQMRCYAPKALDSFRELANTGQVEFLAETYYHSVASLFSESEFRRQVELHRSFIRAEFGRETAVFRNTELLYSNDIARVAHSLGFSGIVAEGVDAVLGWRTPNVVFQAAGSKIPLILRNYRLSDDIAFRFRCGENPSRALSAPEFARRLAALPLDTDTVGIFVDYETFGEHHNSATSVLDFLQKLPEAILAMPSWGFASPTELASRAAEREILAVPAVTSWADEAKDSSAWTGNQLQQSCIARLYALEENVLRSGDEQLLAAWRRLQASDHFYYMCTKGGGDGSVHSYFSPFASPYEAFIVFMNVMKDLERKLAAPC